MRLTLNGVLLAAIVGLSGLLAGLWLVFDETMTEVTTKAASELRRSASLRVASELGSYFSEGHLALGGLAKQLEQGSCTGPRAESCLMTVLLENSNFAEVTLTEAKREEFAERGFSVLAPEGRRQISVFRRNEPGTEEVCTRQVSGAGEKFTATTACRPAHDALGPSTPIVLEQDKAPEDPTDHASFRTPAREQLKGQTIWTDLSFLQIDESLPEERRRVVVVGLRSVEGPNDQLIGVLRLGMRAEKVAELAAGVQVNPSEVVDPYKIFIVDDQSRLISGLCAEDKLKVVGDDIRIQPHGLAGDVAAALKDPTATAVSAENPQAEGVMLYDGERYFVTYRYLSYTPPGESEATALQDWRVGIVGPERLYSDKFAAIRKRGLQITLGVILLLFVGSAVALRAIRGAFRRIQTETSRMTSFEFASSEVRSPFADVRDTLFSLEKAKTAVRAMGKYVPMSLVRRLFEANSEPMLGGTMREVTIFFSDIEGFTTRAEAEPPDVVALWLGRYLAVMTNAVHAEGGTVDKFIGDSVMALWNAPNEAQDHAVLACTAALRSQRDTRALYKSAEWGGRAGLVTRIGLHVGQVMVGHFGAPDRLSYTAIGDSVNLASRIEGLNKQYGTTLLASEDVYLRAKHLFAFRKLDTVAVKGKSQAIAMYELLGELSAPSISPDVVKRYEQALAHYCAGQFAKARELLLENKGDVPSKVLADKCGELERNPPAEPWAGISFAHSK